MSWWILPTTADIGLRAFSADPAGAMREAALGMQDIQMATGVTDSYQPKNESNWTIEVTTQDYDRLLVRWLEEVLYRGQAEGEWLCDATIKILDGLIQATVTVVDSDIVNRELEIKAVTMHEVALVEISPGEVITGVEPDIPSFEGPGWMAQVVFDI
tara:strand:- start:1219 stop:1689 length:471 start_codon:yes stop_codon:yes gene_type:complete